MTIHDVAHKWANKNVYKSAKAGSVFADVDNIFGGTIYSFGYHYPIAVWVGERSVLLNGSRPTDANGGYVQGSYTSKHKGMAIAALSSTVRIIHVNNPKDITKDGVVLPDVVLQNYKGFLEELKAICAKQVKARTADYSKQYNYTQKTMLAYLSLRGNVKGMTKFMREVFRELETADLTRMCEVFGHEIAREAEAEAKRKAKERAADLKRDAILLANAERAKKQFLNKLDGWNRFSFSTIIREKYGDLLVEHDEAVVTSSGVRIAMKDAEIAWRAVKNDVPPVIRARFGGEHIGRPEGDTYVFGCHRIKKETIELFAQKMQWT